MSFPFYLKSIYHDHKAFILGLLWINVRVWKLYFYCLYDTERIYNLFQLSFGISLFANDLDVWQKFV